MYGACIAACVCVARARESAAPIEVAPVSLMSPRAQRRGEGGEMQRFVA